MNQVHYSRVEIKKFLEDRFPETNWSEVVSKLPPITFRNRWNEYAYQYGLPYRRGYMQNLDAAGKGPKSYIE